MTDGWNPESQGTLVLPSGRILRGRALRKPVPDGPSPEFGLYLLGHDPGPTPWPHRWLRWPDFGLPPDRAAARDALIEAWERASEERVEVACRGGRGRTGTALACVAVLDGVPPAGAVAYVRQHYDGRAVETPWQRRYVARFNRR
ncbi:MAG: protein phosphatase [Actinomycetota bacterium]|nr:protein phosphatase [Actinomycetota bacterium]